MRVLIIADPHIPVPPVGYGGIERIAYQLARGLHDEGHIVHLMAGNGSKGDWSVFHHRAPNQSFSSRASRKTLFQFTSVSQAWNADVVFSFSRPDYLWALFLLRMRVVQIFQNPVSATDLAFVPPPRSSLRLVSVSNAQRRASHRPDWITVPNSVPVSAFRFEPNSGSHLAFLGRLHPSKGAHIAIRVARAVRLPLQIAGNIPDDPLCRDYFAREIAPQLGNGVEWIGEVGHNAKVELLASAKALLFPITWDEPFGIVMAEALACGTPVVALRRGAVPEVLRDGVTGFICDTEAELIAAVPRLDCIDRRACRAECEARFSDRAMVAGYAAVALGLLKERRAAAGALRSGTKA